MEVGEPYMTKEEKDLVIHYINKLQPKKVLEYGIGWSTVHFSNFNFIEHYYGVEHNAEWIETVNSKIDQNRVKLLYCPMATDTFAYASSASIDNYVKKDSLAPFDFIFIDGDYRWQCLEWAAKNLTPNGFCMVHDSARMDMHKYFVHFKHHKILTLGEFNSHNDWHQGLTILWNFDGEI